MMQAKIDPWTNSGFDYDTRKKKLFFAEQLSHRKLDKALLLKPWPKPFKKGADKRRGRKKRGI